MGLVDGLLARGLEHLVARVFHLLTPADMRACRQVCAEWNLHVLALWRSKPGKVRLEAKLREGWTSSTNMAMQLGLARSQVFSVYSDDRHVFCGQHNQVVGVHCASSGRWMRDLAVPASAPTSATLPVTGVRVAGSTAVVAAASGEAVVVWCKQGLHQVYSGKRAASGGACPAIAVSGCRVVTMTASCRIVVVDKVGDTWGVVRVLRAKSRNPLLLSRVAMGHVDSCGAWIVGCWSSGGQVSVWRDGVPLALIPLAGYGRNGMFRHVVTGLHLAPPHVILSTEGCWLLVRCLEGNRVVRSLATEVGKSMGLTTSHTLAAHLVRLDNSQVLKVYDKAGLVDANVADEMVLLRVVELGPGLTTPPALATTCVVWTRGRTLVVADYWVQRWKCEEQVEREREELARAKREAEEEARLAELKRSRPSYVSEEVVAGEKKSRGEEKRRKRRGGKGGH